MIKSGNILPGTLRFRAKDLQLCEKTASKGNYWKKTDIDFPEAMHVIKLFKSHKKLKLLIDKKDSRFLKGQLYKNKVQGARLNVLPSGEKVDKTYSLFAPHLTIHDEKSNEHWDVIFMNPNGSFSYIYTLDKKQKALRRKYNKVKEFEKLYSKLKRKVTFALKDKTDDMALLIHTLLKTNMRVGNELYYKLNGHKGLTTLMKKDVTVKDRIVTFKYLAKDGVPIVLSEKFSQVYIETLTKRLNKIKKDDFIFAGTDGHPIHEDQFKIAFKNYCGTEFYPHIVRSYYATTVTKKFLEKHKQASKEEVKKLFLSIAKKLGHKKFSKKNDEWEDNFTVTLNHYIEPKLVKKVKKLVK